MELSPNSKIKHQLSRELDFKIAKNLNFNFYLLKKMLFCMEKITDVNILRNGCITQVLTNVDIDEILKMGRKIFNIYDGIL